MVENGKSLAGITFRKLSRLYIIALSTIALSVIISQFMVQRHLRSQLNDSRIVNVAGRQRMLSQKLTKEALLLQKYPQSFNHQELENTYTEWMTAHEWLQKGEKELGLPGKNSPVIKRMFEEITPFYHTMVRHCDSILQISVSDSAYATQLQTSIDTLLLTEPVFLDHMNRIVFQFDDEASTKVKQLRKTELWLLILALFIIIAELIFIFRPTAFHMERLVSDLTYAEERSKSLAEETDLLYQKKKQSLQELQTLNFALDQAALFASVTTEGEVLYMSKKFCTLLGLKDDAKGDLVELISAKEGEQEYLKKLILTPRSTIWSGEIKLSTTVNTEIWLEMSIIPVNKEGIRQNVLIICSDITSRKKAQAEIDSLKESHFQEQIQQQKLRSSQVVEAQEEERKRIARDIHDGIGQMLAALKYNIQAIDLNKPEKAANQLKQLNKLAAGLIQGVRIATFNLTPPELIDYGIATALAKLAEELSKLSSQQILFHNRTGFNIRFSSMIETNLYRITQEAVNNAIKYAQSEYILITLSHSNELLSIVIDDNGKGFDLKAWENTGASEEGTGMGIAFMQERIHFINGRLFVHSAKDEGTRITVNMPI